MSKPEAPPVMSAPNVIPMADIMLVLLIIFMVITPLLGTPVPVVMAKAANANQMSDAGRDDAVILAVTRDSCIFLSPGNREIGFDQIADNVKDLVSGRLDKTVYVRSDARAKCGDVVRAVDEVRAAGVENIGLLTEKIESKSAPPPGD